MNKKVTFLTPIEVETPPYNTKLHWPRCFTCEHFPICTDLRSDYLKTCLLIEEILGNPQQDLNLQKSRQDVNCGCYNGNPIEDADQIFPATLTFTKRFLPNGEVLTENVEGTFMDAIYQDLETVLFRYNSEGYIIVFKAIYNIELQEFEIMNGTEVVYGIIYEFPTDSVLELQVNLDTWKTEMEERGKDIDIINTTHFSAMLNCDFFKPVRGLTPEEGVKRIIAKYPEGVPCGDGLFYHLETLHIEPYKKAWWNPNAGRTAFVPAALPIFVPAKCKKNKPCTYEDLHNENF